MAYYDILGPYTQKDGRKIVSVKLESGKRTTISYPRFLVETKLGIKLKDSDHVHHKDGNFRNNKLSNLEVLNGSVHLFNHASKPAKWIKFICPFCKKVVQKDWHDIKWNWAKGRSGPFCSRKCAGKFPGFIGKSEIVEVSESLKEETF